MQINRTWAELKTLISTKGASVQYLETSKEYTIWILDGQDEYLTNIDKDSPATTDQTDFETNYKSSANTKVAVQTTPFAANKVEFCGTGVNGTATKNTTSNVDLLISQSRIINGGMIYFDKCVPLDTFTCQVIDIDGVYAPAGTVLSEWITDWNAIPGEKMDLTTPQAGSLPPGVYLRVKYTSTGTTDDVTVLVNYRLNKVL